MDISHDVVDALGSTSPELASTSPDHERYMIFCEQYEVVLSLCADMQGLAQEIIERHDITLDSLRHPVTAIRRVRLMRDDVTMFAAVAAARHYLSKGSTADRGDAAPGDCLAYYDDPLRVGLENLARDAKRRFTATPVETALDALATIIYCREGVEDDDAHIAAFRANIRTFEKEPESAEKFFDEYRVLSLLPDVRMIRSRYVDLAYDPSLRGKLEAAIVVATTKRRIDLTLDYLGRIFG